MCRSARADGFTLQRGSGLLIAALGWTRNTDSFGAAGGLFAGDRIVKNEASLYGEYGVTDWLTALGQGTFVERRVNGLVPDRYSGLDLAMAGLRARFLTLGPAVFSVQGEVFLPGAGDRLRPAQAGHTGAETDLRLQAGASFAFWSWTGFVTASAGWRSRSQGPASEMRADFTLGLRPKPRWLWLFQSFNTVSAGHGGPGYPAVREFKLATSIVYDVTRAWSVQLGSVGTIAGRNTPRDTGLFGAIWYHF